MRRHGLTGFHGQLTDMANGLFEVHGNLNAGHNVYPMALPSDVLFALNGESTYLTLALIGSGLMGGRGSTDSTTLYDGFDLDFAKLEIQSPSVPEPATTVLAAAGLTILAPRRRARGRQPPSRDSSVNEQGIAADARHHQT